MPYAIIRHAKIKTIGNLKASAEHTFRERDTPNADARKTHLNEHDGAISSDEVVQRFQQEFPDKLRKNGVLAIEYLMTASPEWWEKANKEQQDEFFKRSRDFLCDRHGKENVLYTGTQVDETSPHMVAYVLPRDDKGKMNAAHFLDGRQKLSECQDRFAEKVRDLGLARGMEGSKAKHEQVKRHYGIMAMSDKISHEPKLSIIDKASIKLGKPTQNASEALSIRHARETVDFTLSSRKRGIVAQEKALHARSDELDTREKAIKPREEALTKQGREVFAGKEAGEQREKVLKEQAEKLRKQLTSQQEQAQEQIRLREETYTKQINQDRETFNQKLKALGEKMLADINALKATVLGLTTSRDDALKRAITAEKALAKTQDKGQER